MDYNDDRMTIKDAAHLLGIAPSTLRYWEQEGLFSQDRDRENNYRTFSLRDLIETGDILFYRNLGVPLSTLRGYQQMTTDELEDMLSQTQKSIDDRLRELQSIKMRLLEQRSLFGTLRRLDGGGLMEGMPTFSHLEPIDYSADDQLRRMIQHPQTYGIVIEASTPHKVDDALIGTGEAPANSLWQYRPGEYLYLECMVAIENGTLDFDATPLFDQARTFGFQPVRIIGHFLATARGTLRYDYHRAWIECATHVTPEKG